MCSLSFDTKPAIKTSTFVFSKLSSSCVAIIHAHRAHNVWIQPDRNPMWDTRSVLMPVWRHSLTNRSTCLERGGEQNRKIGSERGGGGGYSLSNSTRNTKNAMEFLNLSYYATDAHTSNHVSSWRLISSRLPDRVRGQKNYLPFE